MTELEQAGFDARLEWGVQGAVMLAKVCPVVAVVDVLRFTTAVEVAVGRGAPWSAPTAGPTARRCRRAGSPSRRRRCWPSRRRPVCSCRPRTGRRWPWLPPPGRWSWPAVEDLVGAGAVLHALAGRPSPEARAAVAAFLAADDLAATLADCASGRELAARGPAADLPLAAEHDVSQTVPVLRDGAFGQLSWPG